MLPGLQLQFRVLSQGTALLPALTALDLEFLPDRWALNTPGAIASGVIYTLLSSIHDFAADWKQRFPQSEIALTGGVCRGVILGSPAAIPHPGNLHPLGSNPDLSGDSCL
ncbi:type III pantothenate kinase [Neosynechococcus sphagnicola]|uniref:type III pantothenate kinase n=1 Tax=Neosynechococcus sphagnicola TaxID=1501145 RepID=UPI00195536FE|nr:type III pantothenate kinase [Neosynechococcus sphagnicola]